MPPKKHTAKADAKSGAKDNVDDAPLQAVILADSYNRRFEVLCLDKPRILLPMCGIPLLNWTLECLSSSKVKQVFIFCGVHGDQIREFVADSPFNKLLDIQCLSSTTAFSAGDALRELDAMHVLNPENPFILVHNALVSNYDISEMVEAHKKRRETDKNVIMTMGVGRGGREHPESPVMLVHPPSSRLLSYTLNPLNPRRQRVAFAANLFLDPWPATIDEYEVWSGTSGSSSRGGYRDLGVDICEADVPALCTENFDYHDLRRHFVNGVLTSELLGKNINVHLVGDQESGAEDDVKGKSLSGRYVERVRDTRSYGDITNDVLRRWVFPLVPDVKVPGGADYELRRGNIYVSREHVVLSRTTTLQGPLLIASRCELSHNTVIQGSTIGANCKIAQNATIRNSYIFGDARIGENCVLNRCIIGFGVTLGDNVTIGRGVLIGDGVTIASGVTVEDFSRIGREKYRSADWDSDDESDGEITEESLKVLTSQSTGFLWPKEEEEVDSDWDEDEGDDPYEHPGNKKLLQLGRRLSDVSRSSATASTLSVASSSTGTPMSLASDIDLEAVAHLNLNDGPAPAFFTEIRASLARAFDEDHSIPNALLEIKTLVMGYNSGIDLAREEVVNYIMSQVPFEGGAAKILTESTETWERWGGLATSLCRDSSEVALDVQTFCVRNEQYGPWFGVYLRSLYDGDVVDEEGLIEWRSLSAARGDGAEESEREAYKAVFVKGKQYVDVLEDMDSDSDDDDDDDDDDDSE